MLTENTPLITSEEALEQLAPPTPVLITEQEVALGTTIALQPRPKTRRRWAEATHIVVAAVQRALAPSPPADRRRSDYPKHYAFLENACMSREMGRL